MVKGYILSTKFSSHKKKMFWTRKHLTIYSAKVKIKTTSFNGTIPTVITGRIN